VVHVAKYMLHREPTNGAASPAIESELEFLLDQVQPGWRAHVVARRFLPSMTVSQALPRARDGGLRGRPAVEIAERPRVFLAGDWVGPRGTLADAAAASARDAAQRALAVATRSEVGGSKVAHVGR
jgi:hypothetical protein